MRDQRRAPRGSPRRPLLGYRTTRLACGLTILTLSMASGQSVLAQNPTPAQEYFLARMDPPYVLPEGVVVKADIVFASPNGRDLHLDLLHAARRRWRHEVPNCRLVTLEWHLCGRQRSGDIPGSEIPRVYHEFVRRGYSASMKQVFHHNVLDLVTLAELLWEIARTPMRNS